MEIYLSQVLFQVLNFAIIFYLLKRFVYKPVLRLLDNRATKIKEGLEAAEKNLNLQEEMEANKKRAADKARRDAQKVVTEAKKQAEELIKEAQKKAKVEARQVLEKEKQAFEAEMSKKEKDFNKSLAKLVTQATESVLRGAIDVKLQKNLIDKQIKGLSSKQFSSN